MGRSHDFGQAVEWRVAVSSDAARNAIKRVAHETQYEFGRFSIEDVNLSGGLSALVCRISLRDGQGGPIGRIHVEDLPGSRSRVRIPAGRGSPDNPEAWRPDVDGLHFSAFLEFLLVDFRAAGLISAPSRFSTATELQVARRELDSAADASAFAGIGVICRGALIQLANELFKPMMLGDDEPQPKGNDAKLKLNAAIAYYFAGRTPEFRTGLRKLVEAAWELAQALQHKTPNATRSEAEIALVAANAVFDSMRQIVPD